MEFGRQVPAGVCFSLVDNDQMDQKHDTFFAHLYDVSEQIGGCKKLKK